MESKWLSKKAVRYNSIRLLKEVKRNLFFVLFVIYRGEKDIKYSNVGWIYFSFSIFFFSLYLRNMLQRSNMNSIFGELPFSRIEHSRYPYASGLKMVPPRKSISNRHPLPLLSYLFLSLVSRIRLID